jgi:hypothetical protein
VNRFILVELKAPMGTTPPAGHKQEIGTALAPISRAPR